MRGLLDTLRSLTRSPPPPGHSEGGTTSTAGTTMASGRGGYNSYSAANHPQGRTQPRGTQDDPALAAAVAASLVDSPYPVGTAVYAASDEDASMEAAIAASLDAQDAAASEGRGDRYSGTSSRTSSKDDPHACQDIAVLTDRPLLPPSDYGTNPGGGANRNDCIWGSGHGGTSDSNRGAIIPRGGIWAGAGGHGVAGFPMGAPKAEAAFPSGDGRRRNAGDWQAVDDDPGLRRPRTDEDEALARRLQEQWISEDTAGGGDSGVGVAMGGGLQWPGLMTQVGLPLAGLNARICLVCGLPITERSFGYNQAGCFHTRCMPAQDPVPPCKVCHERLPSQGGRFHFYRHNYFNDLYCPWHHDSAARCCSCMRLEPMPRPGGEGHFAELTDGRMVCMSCAQTAVVDSAEGAPAYRDICRFFEQELNLTVPKEMWEVPVLVVDSPTLNEQTHRDPSHGGGVEQGMPTTRGLTLSEVATLRHMAAGAMHFNAALGRFEVGPPTKVYLGERRAVTAILVLCGLPYASFSSILAHEAMHAWMKLDTSFPTRLPSQVEEGCCQLIALLWLEHLAGQDCDDEGAGSRSGDSPISAEELRGFFIHQIKTDKSVVYGDGFRLAKAAYDAVGLDMLLHHVKCYQSFPVL